MTLIVRPQVRLLERLHESSKRVPSEEEDYVMRLPNPVLKNGKPVPRTLYTSKNFDTARSSTINSRWVVTDDDDDDTDQCTSSIPENDLEQAEELEKKEVGDDDEEEEHLPVGQHLLLDIRNVEAAFLASEERLAQAMLDVVNQCGLTLLSYHCHGLEPAGVSCVGVLLESHVSFHTWPSEGVITFDLFTCGSNSLLPIVSTAEELFGIPDISSWGDTPDSIWAYKPRGFGSDDADSIAELTDLFTFPIGSMTDYKKQILSVDTGYQRIDVYDVLRPHFQSFESYKQSLKGGDSYESQNRHIFQPDRIVFLDGVLQHRRSGGAPYFESLVHPAVFAHRHPRRILILAGGDGGILREVLKHRHVQEIVMIDEDEELVRLSQWYLPEYSDCSQLVGVPDNCFEDPRVEMYFGDTSLFFEENFGDDDEDEAEENEDDYEDPFDVIIMDEM